MKSIAAMKLAFLVSIFIALMVALNMIQDVVHDRQMYRSRAINSIGSSQVIIGPVIHAACVESWDEKVKDGDEQKQVERRREFGVMALPETLVVRSGADIESRARGLHRVNAFNLKLQMTATWGSFAGLTAAPLRQQSRVSCGAPVLMVSVTDPNGIRSASFKLDEQPGNFKAGTSHPTYKRGVHAMLPDSIRQRQTPMRVDFDLELFGTESLSIVPVAETTQIRMQSDWRHPSFGGNFLPVDRLLGARGFDASWRISSLASSVTEGLRKSNAICHVESDGAVDKSANCLETIRVSFIEPVNPYSLSDRATKYGVLFIVLTFAAVGLFEVMQRLRVHPVQYFLVGSALSIFFLLLVSLSEHIAFNWAYLAAASACVLLLTYYGCYMLRGLWRGLPFGLGIAVLYGLLFVLLQLEQTALVVGAGALFMVLAAVMFFTRKVDWYRLGNPSAAV